MLRQDEAVRHIETTLARSMFNCDETAAYAGTALAFKHRLVVDWNNTQQRQTFADQKRIYCPLLAYNTSRELTDLKAL